MQGVAGLVIDNSILTIIEVDALSTSPSPLQIC
jgi:hypothetical protein